MNPITFMVSFLACLTLSVILNRVTSNGLSGQKSIELRSDLNLIRNMIAEEIDCSGTFSVANIDPTNAVNCPSTSLDQKPPYMRIKRRTDGPIPLFLGSTLQPDGSFALGEWRIRASCSNTEESLVVRAARVNAAGFLKDPLTSQLQDWSNPRGLIFGGSLGTIPLCSAAKQQGQIFSTNIGFYDAGGGRISILATPGPSYESGIPAVPFATLTQLPPLPEIHITRDGALTIFAAVNTNYNGNNNPCATDLMSVLNYQLVIDVSRDGGATFSAWNTGPTYSLTRSPFNYGASLMNGGGDISVHGSVPVQAGNRVVLRPKIRWQRSPAYNCISDWGAWGGMTAIAP